MHKEALDNGRIVAFHDFLSAEECIGLITASEQLGYTDAPITMGGIAMLLKDARNNMRVMVDDTELAIKLFMRARPFLPPCFGAWQLLGFNERLRFYRYDVSQAFTQHYDGSFRRNDQQESQLTFMIYLNEDFTGGTTDFFTKDGTLRFSVKPKQGMALVFKHRQLHSGTEVYSGRKYVLRTDVMYTQATEARLS